MITATEGDQLFLQHTRTSGDRVRVARVTKTLIVLDDGRKFRAEDGRVVGSTGPSFGGFRSRLVPIDTPHLLLNEARAKYVTALRLLSEYTARIAAYADPLMGEQESVSLDGLWAKVVSERAALQEFEAASKGAF